MKEVFLRTRKFLLIVLVIYVAYLAVSYFIEKNRTAPACADKESIESVYKIIRKAMSGEGVSQVDMKLVNIITLDKNSDTGAYFCQGELNVTSNTRSWQFTIDYNNRLIEDEKGSFLTTVTNAEKNN